MRAASVRPARRRRVRRQLSSMSRPARPARAGGGCTSGEVKATGAGRVGVDGTTIAGRGGGAIRGEVAVLGVPPDRAQVIAATRVFLKGPAARPGSAAEAPAPVPIKLAVTPAGFDDMGKLLGTLGDGYRFEVVPEKTLADPAACARFDAIFLTCAEAGGPAGSAGRSDQDPSWPADTHDAGIDRKPAGEGPHRWTLAGASVISAARPRSGSGTWACPRRNYRMPRRGPWRRAGSASHRSHAA